MKIIYIKSRDNGAVISFNLGDEEGAKAPDGWDEVPEPQPDGAAGDADTVKLVTSKAKADK